MSGITQRDHKTILWHGYATTVRMMLSLEEVTQFIDSVIDTYHISGGLAYPDRFFPENIDFAFRVNTVMRYACIDLPEELEDQYAVMYATDLFDVVSSNVNQAQLKAIRQAIDYYIARLR